jgi:N-methylhydantoinase B
MDATSAEARGLEILWTQLESITREMEATLVRTAFSTAIRDAGDCACALFDADGRMISQASTAPGQLGSMPFLMKDFLREVPAAQLQDGDVFITNHPWLGCGHTPDFYVITPIFCGAELYGFAANSGHHADVGGRLGAQDSREVYEEGLLVPFSHLHHAGIENRELMALMRLNSRLPAELAGDLRAQVAANHTAVVRLRSLASSAGLTRVALAAAAEEIIERSARAMRQAVSTMAPGVHRGALTLDDTDERGERLRIAISVWKEGDAVVVDFDGTSPQVAKPINSVLNYSRAYVFVGLKMAVAAGLPTNAGTLSCLQVRAPEGSLVHPLFPAPVRWRTTVGLMIADLVLTVLGTAMPDRVIAASGTVPRWHQVFSSRTPGRRFVLQPHFMGGLGAAHNRDGLSAVAWPANLRELSIEAMEHDAPLMFLRKCFRPDSGGAGRFRGGLGEEIAIQNPLAWQGAEAGPIHATLNCGRFHAGAVGLAGGLAGAAGELRVNGVPISRSRAELTLMPGDVVEFFTPGGGGFGHPAERNVTALTADLEKGFISAEAGGRLYGHEVPLASPRAVTKA